MIYALLSKNVTSRIRKGASIRGRGDQPNFGIWTANHCGHRRYYNPIQYSALEGALIGGPPDLG